MPAFEETLPDSPTGSPHATIAVGEKYIHTCAHPHTHTHTHTHTHMHAHTVTSHTN